MAPVFLAVLLGSASLGTQAARIIKPAKSSLEAVSLAEEEGEVEQLKTDCSGIILGGLYRGSGYRRFSDNECKCPHHWLVAGEDTACEPYRGTRYFGAGLKSGKCKCEFPGSVKDYIAVDHMEPTTKCSTEYHFKGNSKGLPDLLEHAHEWCNADLVPKDKRVPESMRGLFWMRNKSNEETVMCQSLSEWDAETRTMRMPVWNSLVFAKKTDEKVPDWAKVSAGQGSGMMGMMVRNPLVYIMKFSDETFSHADVKMNSWMMNNVVQISTENAHQTADGVVQSESDGELLLQKFAMGDEVQHNYMVQIMKGDGQKLQGPYELMMKEEAAHLSSVFGKGATLVRYHACK